MKAKDLRKSSPEDLSKQLETLLREQFNLRMQKGMGQLSRPSQVRAVRRDIARVKTIIHEMQAGGGR
ncbi:MAG: 50S ribosomal protein L29 [Chromatiaceae bacterium]|jgi:large subunit ribosomal protein L29|nr:50S ribosomal protein L29 [Chromatiaceae bacterium]